ncbi:FecR family protein [Negadavirga shengliensis]|uniref:FecR family protein n=1 Tax=Negadavirga shengliensis TaxID=1389218 RepID=A0ABV9SX52_9BACT
MGLSNYTVEDFVLDPEFRKWVLHPNNKSNVRWDRYLEENPDYRENILLARKIVLHLEERHKQAGGLSESDKIDIWKNIKIGVGRKNSAQQDVLVVPISSEAILSKTAEKSQKWLSFWRYAAVLLFALALGLSWVFFGERKEEETVVTSNWQVYETPLGVKSTITLSDGSVVTLNSGSQIRFKESFTGQEREIFLEGEAFFVVARDTLKPFIVHAGGLSTQVLGTSFNIKAFKDEMTEISLVAGLVEVKEQQGDHREKISPGEGILSAPDGGNWKRRKIDVEYVTAWMHKTIVFDNTPFETAMRTLEKWYGVQIKLVNFKDKELKVTGKYQDETLKNILDGLGYGVRIDYRIKGKEVTIIFE